MAGAKGRSGGARPNTGGARPGAGRPRKLPMVAPHVAVAPDPAVTLPPPPDMAAFTVTQTASSAATSPPLPPPEPDDSGLPITDDPLVFLLAAMNNPRVPLAQRVRAAITATQYKHTRTRDGGKKDARKKAADETAAASKFTPGAAPLKLVNRQ